ncbi:serine hydrolase domain-containing protein [Kribbella solani]|uniref:CubicO group peptidase (Beta-lactamase class C family) n=1 Tax=Kribbella solani TaxID=236067 RepID=A0A841DN47_9ACTN|nr:serine hydrolase domain-containing protein [Kribbella solani]MBB5979962.1 CubicO group peptidase (beta-lactamase class C family) [Kribbella solani]
MPDAVDELCEGLLRREHLPSISVAIGVGDAVVDTRSYGFADRVHRIRPARDTAYLLASVTKPITATAVVLLAQHGLLDLDQPIEELLGGLRLPRTPAAGAAPTIRQTLNHTAGLGTYWDFYYADRGDRRPPFAQTVERYGLLFRPAGSAFEYSNLGYGLCDQVIATVTGEDPAEFVRREIFQAVGASTGRVGARYRGIAPPARPYPKEPFGPYPDFDSSHRGASLAWLSAEDLVRFGLSHCGTNSVLTPDSIEQAHSPGLPEDSSGESYTLGWGIRRSGSTTILSHGGDMGGVGAVLVIVPEHQVAVSVLINRSSSLTFARAVSNAVLDSLVPGFTPPISSPPLSRGPRLGAGGWSGVISTYEGDVPLYLKVDADGSVDGSIADQATVTAVVDSPGPDDVFEVNLTLPQRMPTADCAKSAETTICLDLQEHTATGAARATRRGEPAGRMSDCRTHWVQLTRT